MSALQLLETLKGQKVTYVWTDYSALFIEFGKLSTGKLLVNGAIGHPIGEISLSVGYTWRIERIRSVIAGSNCNAKKRISASEKLLNSLVEDINISNRIPELQIEFSNGLWLQTFNPDPKQPDWMIKFNQPLNGNILVANGKPIIRPD